MKHKIKLLVLWLAVGVAGCSSLPAPPDSSGDHPANPRAAQGAFRTPVPMLLNATNLVVMKPKAEVAPEHEHERDQGQARPENKKEQTK